MATNNSSIRLDELNTSIADARRVLDKIGRNNQAWAQGRKTMLLKRISRLEQQRKNLLDNGEKE